MEYAVYGTLRYIVYGRVHFVCAESLSDNRLQLDIRTVKKGLAVVLVHGDAEFDKKAMVLVQRWQVPAQRHQVSRLGDR